MGTFVTFGGSQKKLRLETFIKIQNSFGFCQRVSKDDVKISHRFFQEAFWWDILSDTVQWCLPFLPTRTCCSRHTPYQKPTSPQSLSRGHAPWAIHTPGGFSNKWCAVFVIWGSGLLFALTLRPGGLGSPQIGGFCGRVAFWGERWAISAFFHCIATTWLFNGQCGFLGSTQ